MKETTNSESDIYVANSDCFSQSNLAKLKEIMYDVHVQQGSRLFWEGDTADKLYYLKRGRVKITKCSDDGKHFVLYVYNRGDLFGQIDPFHHSEHNFNAEVTVDAEIGVLQQKDLEIMLWQHGDLAVEFMKWMGLMHRMTQTKFRDLMMFGKPGALCSTLIRLANTYGRQEETGVLITNKWTNNELADMIGATRESVNRMLNDLKKEGIIDMEHGLIRIRQLRFLQDLCQCENCPKDMCRI